MSLLLLFDDDEDTVTDGYKKSLVERYNRLFYKAYLKKTKKKRTAKRKAHRPKDVVQHLPKEELAPSRLEQFQYYEALFTEALQGLALISELDALNNEALAMQLLKLERERDILWLELLRLKRELDDELIIIIAMST